MNLSAHQQCVPSAGRKLCGRRDDVKHVHQFLPHEIPGYNASHTINYLSFGTPVPNLINPLDGVTRVTTDSNYLLRRGRSLSIPLTIRIQYVPALGVA